MTRSAPLSFKQQLFILLAAGILLFSLLSALTTGWLSSKTIGHTLTEQGLQMTTNFARQSVLSLLYEDEESIRDAAAVVLSFPGVQHLAVYNMSGTVIYSHGAVAHPQPVDTGHLAPFKARLVKESDDAWCFVAAVYDIPTEQLSRSPFEIKEQQPAQLGYVRLTLDKSGLKAIQRTVFLENLFSILLLAIILVLLLLHHTGKLIRPLNKLSSLMKTFGVDGHRIRAAEEGAQEVRNMARAFNSMMATLEDHTDKLEKQKQTLELEIKERQQVECHLKDRETHLRTVIENVAEGIIVLSDKEQIESINSAGLAIFHATQPQMIGRELSYFLGGPQCDLLTDSAGRMLAGMSGMGTIEVTGYSDAGAEFPLEISVSDMLIDGHRKFIVMARDITHRKVQELALKNAHDTALDAVRVKSEFLANMSHEIRTPLNGLLGMMELLAGTGLSAEQKEYSDIARSSGDALLNIINEVLDFSKLEAGKIELEKVDFNLIQLLEEVVCLYAPKAQSKGLNISLLISNQVSPHVLGDPVRIRQILSNLIDNAVKFTDSGEVCVRLAPQPHDTTQHQHKVTLMFEVSDTGIGIDESAQEKIFGSFIQADGSATRQFGGTGLGLSIARQLVELMGGTLELSSVAGQGSHFCFTNSFDIASSSAIPAGDHVTNYLSENIEIVLDNIDDTNASIITTYLKSLNITPLPHGSVTSAASAQDMRNKLIVFIGNHDIYANAEAATSKLIQKGSALGMRTHYLLLVNMNDEPGESKYGTHISYLRKPILKERLRRALEQLVPKSLKHKNMINLTRQQPDTPPTCNQPAHRSPKILLAEDNQINQKLTLKMLSKMGYQATVANNGLEVIAALGRSKYDLVLMDCQMPEMDGYQATSIIRNTPDQNQNVTIIAVTGNALSHDRDKCLNAGIDDYLAKPFKYSTLNVVIEKWLNAAPHSA